MHHGLASYQLKINLFLLFYLFKFISSFPYSNVSWCVFNILKISISYKSMKVIVVVNNLIPLIILQSSLCIRVHMCIYVWRSVLVDASATDSLSHCFSACSIYFFFSRLFNHTFPIFVSHAKIEVFKERCRSQRSPALQVSRRHDEG